MELPNKVLLHPSSSAVLFLHDWETVLARLHYFAHRGPDFIVFEVRNGDYIQCAGVKIRLTVETRRYRDGKAFLHEVWGKGAPTGFSEKIECTDGEITVDRSQVLGMRDARLLIRAFLEEQPMPVRYSKTDISHRFDPVPEDLDIHHRAWSWPERRRRIGKENIESICAPDALPPTARD